MNVYIVEGRHWRVPGIRRSVHSTVQGAERAACALLNDLRADAQGELAPIPLNACAAFRELALQEIHDNVEDSADCAVWIDVEEVRP